MRTDGLRRRGKLNTFFGSINPFHIHTHGEAISLGVSFYIVSSLRKDATTSIRLEHSTCKYVDIHVNGLHDCTRDMPGITQYPTLFCAWLCGAP